MPARPCCSTIRPIAPPRTGSSASSSKARRHRAAASTPRWAWPRASPASTSGNMRARPARRSRGFSPITTRPATKSALTLAVAAADWALARARAAGGRLPPCRAATPAAPTSPTMSRWVAALLALHRSTRRAQVAGRRATRPATSSPRTFIDPRTGGFFASASPDARHLPKPIKQREDNVTATRFFTLLAAYSGERALSRDRRGRHGLSRLAGRCSRPTASCPTCCWPRRNCATSRCM